MYRFTENKKGFTIVELIIAVAIIAMVMVSVIAGFTSVAAVNLHTKRQQEIDSVMRTVKEYAKEAVVSGSEVETGTGTFKLRDGSNFYTLNDIKVVGSITGIDYGNYRFDAVDNGYIASAGYINNIREYTIKLKKKDGASYNAVQKFKLQIYIE